MSSSIDRIRRRVPLRPLLFLIAGALFAVNLAVPGTQPPTATGPATYDQVDSWLAHQIADAGIPGGAVVIVRDGQVVHTQAFGTADATGRPVTAETPFVIGSLTKSFTAFAVMQLVDAGQVDLDQPVVRYLPEFRVAAADHGATITVRQLLDHTSGLSTAAGTEPLSTPVTSLDARVRDLAAVAPVSEPGAAYHYSNANYVVAGRLIEQVSGLDYGTYLRTHVFEPLGMTTATTDRSTADAEGLSQAHRLWFGIPDAREPLDRPDLVSAGFIAASADDMGRYLAAQLGGTSRAAPIISAASLEAMHQGIVATGLQDQRYGLGWTDGTLDGVRVVSHTGSTTDMAAVETLVPDAGLGVAVLLNGTSPFYELLHKPDAIGLGAVALLMGREPAGTLEAFYPALDVALIILLAIQLRALVNLARSRNIAPIGRRAHPAARFGFGAMRVYLDVAVPLSILFVIPGWLGPWPSLLRVDIGVVLAAVFVLRVTDGLLRFRRWRQPVMDVGMSADRVADGGTDVLAGPVHPASMAQ